MNKYYLTHFKLFKFPINILNYLLPRNVNTSYTFL